MNAVFLRIKKYSQYNKQRSAVICTLLHNLFVRKNKNYVVYGIKKLKKHKDEEIKR